MNDNANIQNDIVNDAKNERYHHLLNEGYLLVSSKDFTDQTKFAHAIGIINATLFSIYLVEKGVEIEDKNEAKLLAQAFTHQILRDLFDFIEVE